MATKKAKPKAEKSAIPQFSSAARAPGRPRTTVASLPEGWEDQVRKLAQQGAGRCEWQCALGLGNHGYLTLLEDDTHFRTVIVECKLLSQAWWEQLGRRGAAGLVGINAQVWSMNMKNRFRWRDAMVSEVRTDAAQQSQPKTIVRTVMPAVRHTTNKFDVPGDQGVVE